jgi:hypothetical protein
MNFIYKSTVIALAVASLSACQSDDNDDVVAALQKQNEILAAQNANQKEESSVTLNGKVFNLSDDATTQNAIVTIKVGSEWSKPVAVSEDGRFELVNLPSNSDYTLLIKSDNDSFLERVFFGTTKVGSEGVSFQDIGQLSVSEGRSYSYSIFDSVTNEDIVDLELYASSRVIQPSRDGEVTDSSEYYHTSTFNAETKKYDIILPKHIPLNIYASLDIDNNGDDEYRTENYNSSLIVRASEVNKENPIYLIDLVEAVKNIEFRVSVLDKEGNVIENASLNIDDQLNGKLSPNYDEKTLQYVFDAKLTSSLKILSPAMTIDKQSYSSGYINISNNNDKLSIQTYVYNQNGHHTTETYQLPLDTEVVDIVFQPKNTTAQSNTNLELVLKSTDLDTDNTEYKAYYSQPIEINTDTVTLKQRNVLSITKGNDSPTDLVLAGTTLLTFSDIDVATKSEVSLNNTLLTINPEVSLQGGYQYQYLVNGMIDVNSGALVDVSNDNSLIFDVEPESTEEFSINMLKLDNNNYYTNGSLITATNTAGEASPSRYRSGHVYLVIPTIAEHQLKSLTMKKMIVTNQGNVVNNIDIFQVIVDGEFYNSNSRRVLSVAQNEEIVSSNHNHNQLFKGMNIPDGKVRTLNTSEYLLDNTLGSINRITFEYAYETNEGVISTGTIVLPVL